MKSVKVGPSNIDLKEAIHKAQQENPGKMVIVGSSAERGTEVIVGDNPIFEDSDYKKTYGSCAAPTRSL